MDGRNGLSIDGLVSTELYAGGTIQWGNFADFSIGTLLPDMIRQRKKVMSPPWCMSGRSTLLVDAAGESI